MFLDLNCDLGEGCPFDADLLALITSANIACAGHAGDPSTARATLRQAARLGVQVGAHPGYLDREHFGRRELNLSPEQIQTEVLYQVGALDALARAEGVQLRYLKPHGALYNQACRDRALAEPIVAVAEQFGLRVLGLPGSQIAAACAGRVEFVAEGFADRRYRRDGTLVPRSEPDAFVESADEAVAAAERLLREHGVQTLCVHGDNPEALAFVQQLREALIVEGWELRAF